MTFLSGYEQVNKQLHREAEDRARRAVTPQHAACEAAVAGDDDEVARERARRVQHEADPVGELATPDMDKAYRDAYPSPTEYPQPIRVSPEDFRRGPIRDGQGALSPDLEPPRCAPGSRPDRILPRPFTPNWHVMGDCS